MAALFDLDSKQEARSSAVGLDDLEVAFDLIIDHIEDLAPGAGLARSRRFAVELVAFDRHQGTRQDSTLTIMSVTAIPAASIDDVCTMAARLESGGPIADRLKDGITVARGKADERPRDRSRWWEDRTSEATLCPPGRSPR